MYYNREFRIPTTDYTRLSQNTLTNLSYFKGELNPKIKFVLFERTLKIRVSYLSVFDSLASFLRYFSFFDMQIIHNHGVV